jgi:ribonuclease T2
VAPPASATIPLEGSLLAEQDCPAVVSIHRQTNPGSHRLVVGREYLLLAKNRADATHYQVRIEGAEPSARWVAIGCGRLLEPDAPAPGPAAADELPPAGRFVLAATWQPAFCELRRARPECRSQTEERLDASHFSLHGLWPEPRERVYCGVPEQDREHSERGTWSRLPPVDLSETTREQLESLMPGAASHLERHQWTKHGSCYGTGEEAYFRHSLAVLDQLNASPVRDLFAEHAGRHLSARQIRGAFDRAFGRGVGERVRVHCEEEMIVELRISLSGQIREDSPLSQLLPQASRHSVGCRGGRVDTAGWGP